MFPSCRAGVELPAAPAAPTLSLAEVLRAGLPAFEQFHDLPSHPRRILHTLLACRTPALGGHLYACAECGQQHFAPHSCRNRHCPRCQGHLARRWLEVQQQRLLPTPYFHVVFTLPHALNPLIRQNRAALYRLLFEAASATLLEFARNRWQAQLGLTAVLHTWSQTLSDHYHLHCIVTGGGVSSDGARWVGAGGRFLFPVRALSAVFAGKFGAGLQRLFARGQLEFHGEMAALAQEENFQALVREARRRPWVVYAKRPFAGPGQVLAYLSRYTHRVALSERRLVALDRPAQTVRFGYKDYADGGRHKTITLGLGEFVRRFCLHLLPKRFVKIRHYGLLGNRQRAAKLARARALLEGVKASGSEAAAASPEKPRGETDAPALRCPRCGGTRWLLLAALPAGRAWPAVAVTDSS